VFGILANPSYAGTYVFGRYQASKEVGPSGEIRARSRLMPQDAWRITIPNHHEGYISEDQFVANRERLTANRTTGEGLASPVRKACSYVDFAGGASGPTIPEMAASTRFINASGSTGRPWRPAPV
jgi:hypothetical protein